MNNLKVSTRLVILIGVLSTLLVAVGSLGLFSMGSSNQSLKSIYEDRVVALDEIGDINYLVQRNRVLVMDMLVQPRAENIQKRNKELLANVENVTKIWDNYLKGDFSPEEKSMADNFAQTREIYIQEGLLPAAAAMMASDFTTGLEIYNAKISPLA